MDHPPHAVTRLLARIGAGDREAQHELLPLVYDELLRLARGRLPREGPHTLQPTALAHEAWLKLMRGGHEYGDRHHFLVVAARAMRQILADHARARTTRRREGQRLPVEFLEGFAIECDAGPTDLAALHDALTELEALDDSLARVVELRFFGGLEHAEVAAVLDVSVRTAERRWQVARGWLRGKLAEGSA